MKYLLIVVLFGQTLAFAQEPPSEEEYPSNLGPPEVVFACKTVLTAYEGKDGQTHTYGCVECPLNDGRIINTCTGIQK